MEEVIKIENLKKSFGDKEVFNDISLTLHKGESLVVMGNSGTGKTVLIRCIVRLLDVDGGRITVFDKDMLKLNKNELNEIRKKIGFLFQSGALYDSMNVADNMKFQFRNRKSDNNIDELIKKTLEHVGLEDTQHLMPSELSGGMRKRIGLARTIIVKPEIILYDEPTTGLDPISSREISYLINETKKKFNASSIIITHDIECAKITADRIVMINEGKIIAEGKVDDLVNSDNEMVRSFFEQK